MSRMGRPPKEFDWSKLDAILQYKASLEDAAEIMNCHIDTIVKKIRKDYNLTFSEYRDKKMAKVRLSLVQKAIHMAQNGDRTMLIFCLKNLCQWTDGYSHDVNQKNENINKLVIQIDEQNSNE